MKHLMAITSAAFLFSMSSHARVGEPEKEIAARYGEGEEGGKSAYRRTGDIQVHQG
ncbi:MAG: hypothetical protein ACKV19_09045 [Verrucomicrobiales bacterium]